jgi:hypothetical protein
MCNQLRIFIGNGSVSNSETNNKLLFMQVVTIKVHK